MEDAPKNGTRPHETGPHETGPHETGPNTTGPNTTRPNKTWHLAVDRATMLYWGVLFAVTSMAVILLTGPLAAAMPAGVCIGDPSEGACSYAPVAIHFYLFILLATYAVTGAVWVARSRPSDAHPWLVNVIGWIAVVGAIFLTGSLAETISRSLHLRSQPVQITLVAIVTAFGAGLATLIRYRRPAQRWRRTTMLALPAAALLAFGVTIRTDADIRQKVTDATRRFVEKTADNAEFAARQFPKRQLRELATSWLSAATPSFSDVQRQAVEEAIGPIEDAGYGADRVHVVGHVLEEAEKLDQTGDADVSSILADGVLTNIYVLGRRGDGFCLTRARTSVDPKHRFDMVGKAPVPVVQTRFEPQYCVFGTAFYAFDDPAEPPKLLRELGCAPRRAPSPYADSPEERQAAAFLRQAAQSGSPVDPACPAAIDAWTAPEPEEAGLPKLRADLAERLDKGISWQKLAARGLGVVPQLDSEPISFSVPDSEDLIREDIMLATRAPDVPRPETLEPAFGAIADSFVTGQMTNWFDARLDDTLVAKATAPGGLDGPSALRYIIGRQHSGWCLYDLKVQADVQQPARPEAAPIVRTHIDQKPRYCMAGDQLVGFADDGSVQRLWDAAGFPRAAPDVDPYDVAQYVGIDDAERTRIQKRDARDALVRRFLDSLVSGKLNKPSQLDTLVMAEGADQLAPATLQAMRRMVRQGARAPAGE